MENKDKLSIKNNMITILENEGFKIVNTIGKVTVLRNEENIYKKVDDNGNVVEFTPLNESSYDKEQCYTGVI